MKKSFLAIACLAGILSLSSFNAKAAVNEKVLQSFNSVFASATNVKWTEYPNYYYVSFSQNDVTVRAEYDKKGNLVNSIRYYSEQHLPLNILCKIKKDYPVQSIDVVTEVSTQDGVAYIIQLQDKKGWTIVKSDASASFEVTDTFDRAL
jgi:hypothetical protein